MRVPTYVLQKKGEDLTVTVKGKKKGAAAVFTTKERRKSLKGTCRKAIPATGRKKRPKI